MTPKNPWVADVWEVLSRTKQTASFQDLITQFGSVSGVPNMQTVVDNAVRGGWLRRVGGRYEASVPLKLEKGPPQPWRYVEGLGQVSSVFELGARHA